MDRRWVNIYKDKRDGEIWYGCNQDSREDALRNSNGIKSSKLVGRFSYVLK